MKKRDVMLLFLLCAALLLVLCSCGARPDGTPSEGENAVSLETQPAAQRDGSGVSQEAAEESQPAAPERTGLIAEQILDGAEGQIHYSYYLPEGYDANKPYPMMVVMPGYDMMWFGEDSSGSNLNWRGFLCWTQLDEDMIVVSAQLTDWGEKSARQAVELTEYFLENFSVDPHRVYAAGYSAGGETMSQAVAMRPDLYAAYLHGASQWDGDFEPVAENGVAVYIFMAQSDEYYGSQKAQDAYDGLYEAYRREGWTDGQIDAILQVEIPDDAYFNERGITGNYHGGGNVLFEDPSILNWILSPSAFTQQPDGTYLAEVTDESVHAWAEIFLEDYGWVPIEVTPAGDNTGAPVYPGMDSGLLEELLSTQNWNLEGLAQTQTAEQNLDEIPDTTQGVSWTGNLPSGEILAGCLLHLIVLVTAAFWIYRMSRLRAIEIMDVRELFGKMMEAVHFAGMLNQWDGSEPDFAVGLSQAVAGLSGEEAQKLISIVQRAAFGPTAVEDQREEVEMRYRQVVQSVYRSLPFGKKMVFKYIKTFL